MKKILFFVLFVSLFCLSEAKAQSVQTASWKHVGATPALVSSYQFNFKINAGPNPIIIPVCTASGADTVCNYVISAPTIIVTGDTVTVTASTNGQAISGTTIVGAGPKPITTIVITIQIQ